MAPSSRRSFVRNTAGMACTAAISSQLRALSGSIALPVADAHIHLFDPRRPGGVPWPDPADTVLYRPALPERYRALAESQGVLAAIAVECSPLASDNDWLLRTAAESDLIVGVIGDLDPAQEDFRLQVTRLAANPLFRGIRYGNLWNRDLGAHLEQQTFLAHLSHLAEHGLVFESANPTPNLVADLLRLAIAIPNLRIVIDHLPQATPPEDAAAKARYLTTLKHLSERPNVFVKGSEILRVVNGIVPHSVSTYTPWLDTLWQLFGEDRIFFGSDWPNSDHMAPLAEVFAVAHGYLATKSRSATQKYFWTNSIAVYEWRPRNQQQRMAVATAFGRPFQA